VLITQDCVALLPWWLVGWLVGCWTVDGQQQRKVTSIINGALITHTHKLMSVLY